MLVKTPGVYIEEIKLLPPSVAEVATAIPAFVGYTAAAMDPEGKPLLFTPVRIKSLKEYEDMFGKAYMPAKVTVSHNGSAITGVAADKTFFLYDSLRLYFDNGGGPCYIVSVGSYKDTVEKGDDTKGLTRGIKEVAKYDEPTLLLFPDAVLLKDGDDKPDTSSFAGLQTTALAQCKLLQDRFAILDIMEGDKAEGTSVKPISNFRDTIGINALDYGAAYYPWLISSYNYDISYRQLQFAPADISALSANDAEKTLVDKVNSTIAASDASLNKLAPTTADKQLLTIDATAFFKKMIGDNHTAITTAMAIEPADEVAVKAANTAYLTYLDNLVLALHEIETATTDPGIQAAITKAKKDAASVAAISDYVAHLKHAVVADHATGITPATINVAFAPLFNKADGSTAWVTTKNVDEVAANTDAEFTPDQAGFLKLVTAIETGIIPQVLSALTTLLQTALPGLAYNERLAQDALFAGHGFFKSVKDSIVSQFRLIPPSGAIAGVYAAVDNSRGVWKAPANISLNGVVGPVVKLDNKDQEGLNVSDTGKSINAIRSFTGKGTLVWGARTLAGNDNEWRYVPVRRFFIMVEESVKKASQPFVFEPNDANTWIKVQVMIENFLTLQWRAGALQGAKPEQAFYVAIGLGKTMSGIDILEGRMIVEIGMAVVRPAEFIILRFSHKMMEA